MRPRSLAARSAEQNEKEEGAECRTEREGGLSAEQNEKEERIQCREERKRMNDAFRATRSSRKYHSVKQKKKKWKASRGGRLTAGSCETPPATMRPSVSSVLALKPHTTARIVLHFSPVEFCAKTC